MFFVISGYLITRNILRDLEANKFNFRDFYLRRIFRLLPALFVTIIVTLLASYFLLTPEHFASLGRASVASTFSVSNFLFWSESGYFDDAKVFKPLLHTWSLGVEEQFYLIWPLLLCWFFSLGKKWCFVGIAVLGVISTLAAQSLVSDYNAMVFYWMPFRIGEFAMGAVLVFLSRSSCSTWRATGFAGLGLVLTLAPIVFFSAQTLFPALMALVPCLGTALLIHFGRASLVFPLLSNSLFVHIGKISYSLYLVHWPVIVLISYWKLGGLGVKSIVLVMPLTFLLAWVLHHQVEQRFRESREHSGRSRRGLGTAIAMVVILMFGSSVWLGKGWLWRYSAEAQDVVLAVQGLPESLSEKRALLDRYQSSFQDNSEMDRHYIIGDSFAEDTMLAIKLSQPGLNLKLLTVPAQCQPVLPGNYKEPKRVAKLCNEKRKIAYDLPRLEAATTIYLAASWRAPAFSQLADTITFLNSNTSAKVIVFGPRASFHDVPTLTIRHAKREGLADYVNRYKSDSIKQNIQKMRKIAVQTGIRFVDTYQLMCPNDICAIISPLDAKILYSDHAHLTVSGARYLSQRLPQ